MHTDVKMYHLKIHPKFFEIEKIRDTYSLSIKRDTLFQIMDEQGCLTKDIKNNPVMVINPETGGYRIFRFNVSVPRHTLEDIEVFKSPDGIFLYVI